MELTVDDIWQIADAGDQQPVGHLFHIYCTALQKSTQTLH